MPVHTLTYSTTEWTNQDVIVTLEIEDGYRIVSNNGVNTYTFTKNGDHNFEYVDNNGNRGVIVASVDWIDKDVPVGTIIYSTENPTNQNVTATLEVNEEVTITSEGGNTHTFTENGEFIFEFRDKAGNEGSAIANVTWINKNAPIGTITYNITNKTNQDVIATLEVAEGVTVTSQGGKTHTFTKNGEFTFTFVDENGNKGSATANVTWIKKETPTGTVIYNITNKTNQDVIATLEVAEGVTVTSQGGNTHTFTENGEFIFTFVDEYGNEGSVTANVTWINKNAPIGTITYSTTDKTNQDVIATLEVAEGVTVTSEGGKTHTFTENGEFTFTFVDEYGNEGTAIANVTWIDKKDPEEKPDEDDEITSSVYEIEDNIIRKVPLNLKVSEFIRNIQSKKDVIIKDKNQNILNETSKIGTGMKAYVGENTYTFVVKADLDGNGTVNITDLAKICLHYIDKEPLVNEYLEAADIDNNNEITITDLAKMQLLLVGRD